MSPFYLPANENDSLMHEAFEHTCQYLYSEDINYCEI